MGCAQAVPTPPNHRSTVGSAASAVGLPQRPAVILVLIVARRGCGKRFRVFCRLTRAHFCSIRRSQDGVRRPIASPACQLLGLAVLHPCTSLVRSRHPAASESHLRLRSPPAGGIIGAYRSPGPWNTRLVARISNTDASYCTQLADPVDLPAKPRAFGRYELCHTHSVWTGPIKSDTVIPG